LCFHFSQRILRPMLLRYKLYYRRLSCLMAGLFAMQILVGAFCLLTTEAHAMPMVQHAVADQMDTHCAKAAPLHQQHLPTHSGACYHCDQPDELSNTSFSSLLHIAILLPGIISDHALQSSSHVSRLYFSRTPTGPPRSSTLLYTTSPRIRI